MTARQDGRHRLAQDELFTVGEVVRRMALTRKALLVYEEAGLVRPRARTDAGYRLYDHEALRRLELVSYAKSLGLNLAETQQFLAASDSSGEDQDELAAIVERKLIEIEERLTEITLLRDTVRGALDRLAHVTERPRAGLRCTNGTDRPLQAPLS